MTEVAVLLANFLEFKDHGALYILMNDLDFQACDIRFSVVLFDWGVFEFYLLTLVVCRER